MVRYKNDVATLNGIQDSFLLIRKLEQLLHYFYELTLEEANDFHNFIVGYSNNHLSTGNKGRL